MVLEQYYKDEILGYVQELADELFTTHSKESLLQDASIVDRLWTHYQKEVEEYGCDEAYALADTVFEVLNIHVPAQSSCEDSNPSILRMEDLQGSPMLNEEEKKWIASLFSKAGISGDGSETWTHDVIFSEKISAREASIFVFLVKKARKEL